VAAYFARQGRAPTEPSSAAKPRIGVTVSRRLRRAVDRNRARRRVREAARLELAREDSPLRARGITVDVVLIARPEALTIEFPQLAREVTRAMRRAVDRAGSPSA
jgi:ribonuclease P protein component